MSIEAEDTFTRPIYAGNAISTVKSKDDIKVFTVRASTWEAAKEGAEEAKLDTQEATDVGKSERPPSRTMQLRRDSRSLIACRIFSLRASRVYIGRVDKI